MIRANGYAVKSVVSRLELPEIRKHRERGEGGG
jgi:hypothetical protein